MQDRAVDTAPASHVPATDASNGEVGAHQGNTVDVECGSDTRNGALLKAVPSKKVRSRRVSRNVVRIYGRIRIVRPQQIRFSDTMLSRWSLSSAPPVGTFSSFSSALPPAR